MKFKNYIETESGIKDTSTSPGTAGQLLSSTVAGTSWIDQNTISSGTSETIDIQVKNISSANGGINLSKGDPVYIYGSVGASARLYVDLADADSTATNNLGDSKMPCVALLDQDLSPNGEGTATVVGKLRNLITNPIDGNVPNENDTVYVKSGGGLTLTKPTGSTNLIQNVGQVGRVSTSADGNIVVAALLRSNDIPNLPEGRIWVGDSNTVVSDTVYLDETNERMGIGTTSPDSKLTVDGTTRLGGDVEVSELLSGDKVLTLTANNGSFNIGDIDGLGGQAFISGDSSSISISANQITTLHCGSNNRVGVGTTSPQEKMHVSGASNIRLEVEATDSTVAALKLTNTAGSYASFVNAAGDLSVYDYNAASTRTTLRANGNFGIGTTSLTSISSTSVTLSLGATSATTSGGIAFQVAGGVVKAYNYVGAGYLYNQTVSGIGQIFFGAGSERMRIHNTTGNVGINTTDPKTKLHVASANGGDTPTAGTATGGLFVSNTNKTYGINIGVAGSGSSFIQSQRADGNTTLYNLNLQPLGGNVGIGTTTPQAKLHVSNGTLRTWSPTSGTSAIFESTVGNRNFVTLTAANEAELWFGNASTQTLGRVRYEMSTNNMEFWTNATQKMVIEGGGNVGIGTTSPRTKLHVFGTVSSMPASGAAPSAAQLGGSSYGTLFSTLTSGRGVIQQGRSDGTAGTYDLLLQPVGGNVGIGESSPSSKLYIQGSTSTTSSQLMRIRSTTSFSTTPGRIIEFIRSNNTIRGYISMNQYGVQYNTSSDYRLKENITPINDALDRLKKLKPNRFSWKEGPSDYKVDGFIAHEVAEVIPEAISGEKDAVDENNKPSYQGIDQAKIVPLLTAALQEAVTKIEQLETRIQTLENK